MAPIFLFGVSVFLIGSALCGLSQEMWQPFLFRGIQGLGAGALFPVSLAIIGDIFAPSERGKYQGFFGAMFGVAFLIGPAIGGLLTDTVGWNWIFFVNIPLGLVILVVIWRMLPTRRVQNATSNIDYLGAALLVAALVPILVGLTQKQFGEWTDPDVGGLMILGAIMAVVFLVVESRAKEPILPLHLFRLRAFTSSVFAIFLAAMGFFAAVDLHAPLVPGRPRVVGDRVGVPDPAPRGRADHRGHCVRARSWPGPACTSPSSWAPCCSWPWACG